MSWRPVLFFTFYSITLPAMLHLQVLHGIRDQSIHATAITIERKKQGIALVR